MPNGAPLAGGDSLLFGEAEVEAAELPANVESVVVGEFADDTGRWFADHLVESEPFEEALIQEELLDANAIDVTEHQWPGSAALNLAEIDDELALEGSHSFLSGNALMFRPDAIQEAEQTSSSVQQSLPVNGSDLDAMPRLVDLLTDGDEWLTAAVAVPSEISTIQVSVPVSQTADAYDVAVLQHQKALLDVDILAVDTAHIVIT